MQLDPATLIIVQVLGCVLSAVVLASAQRTAPDRSVVQAILGTAMLGCASALLLLRGAAPDVVSIGLANVLVIGSVACMHRAYSLHVRPEANVLWPLMVSAAGAVAFIAAVTLGAGYTTRVLLISSVLIVLFMGCAGELMKAARGS